VATTMI